MAIRNAAGTFAGTLRPGYVRQSRRSVRVRFTVLYSALFVSCAAVLLAVTYLLASRPLTGTFRIAGSATVPGNGIPGQAAETFNGSGKGTPPAGGIAGQARYYIDQAHAATLHELLVYSGVTLAGMAVAAVGLGWLMAGRVLLPLRTMTAATRRITEDNLHQRLNLNGPHDEVKDLGNTIDGLLERLEGAFEAQRRFVANASHEFRTPLATMRAALDVAEAKPEPAPPQTVALAGRMRGQLNQLDSLLDSFLALARVQHGTSGTETTIGLDDLVSDALDQRDAAIADTHLDVRRDRDPHACVSGNPTLLARMVENLIDNAVRHNQPGGFIRVTATATADGTKDRALLAVETGGPILDEDQVRQLVQPFRRLGVDRTGSRNSTGLGLSIVEAIATAHGGTLTLRARPDGGLTASVDLPLAAEPAASRARA
jgi:hypothetical protein